MWEETQMRVSRKAVRMFEDRKGRVRFVLDKDKAVWLDEWDVWVSQAQRM